MATQNKIVAAPPVGGDKKRRQLPPLKTYNCIKLWTGNNIARGAEMLEDMFFDEFQAWTWPELYRYVREKYGNIPCHVRLYGGPRKMDWVNIPRVAWAEAKGDGGDVTLPKERHLAQRLTQLAQEKENLALELELMRERAKDPPAASREETAPEAEPAGSIDAIVLKLVHILLPIGAAWLADKAATATNTPPQVTQGIIKEILEPVLSEAMPHISDQKPDPEMLRPTSERPFAGSDDEYDIPGSVMEFLDKIDWRKTPHRALLEKLEKFGPMLGLVMKEEVTAT